jgi:flagellar motor switch protein FliG
MNSQKLAGSVKAAILVKSFGEDVCRNMLNSLDEQEREQIMELSSQMDEIPLNIVEEVSEEFINSLQSNVNQVHDTVKIKNKTKKNQNSEDANTPRVLKAIKSMSADQLVRLLKDEHPQTIAIIIIHLESSTASDVLSRLPDDLKIDVSYRIAKLDKIVTGMIEEIDLVFDDLIKENKTSVTKETEGINRLAEILNQIDGPSSGMILDELEEQDQELVDQIRQLMFVFDDLVLVDDRGLQNVLRSVETKELALALKAASDDVKNKIYKNMSERACAMLKEEISSLGAVRMKEVADAQLNITRIIQDKESKGELVISGRGGDQFIG